MIEINFYYDESVSYKPAPASQMLQQLDEVQKVGKVIQVSKIERARLTDKAVSNIIEEIRSIKPQARGSVVTSGGDMLPLSGSKKLNLNNTPVVLVRSETGPLYVFPCRVGEIYYSVSAGLQFLKENLPSLKELPAGTEESIVSAIQEHPEILEDDLDLVSSEVETSRGRGDLLFIDRSGKPLLVEVEREDTDQAIGQILRLCAGYENKQGLKLGTIRGAIACIRINDNVLAAAKRAGIEVWKIGGLDGNNIGENNSSTGSPKSAEYFPA